MDHIEQLGNEVWNGTAYKIFTENIYGISI